MMYKLTVDEVVRLINTELIFKPGWAFEASDHTRRFQDCVKVRIHYPARNSDREEARKGYPTEMNTYADYPLLFGDIDASDYQHARYQVMARLLGAIASINSHEDREFLRIPGDDFDAPFHPHRFGEIARWEHVTTALPGLPDLQFGVA